ncbi:hypothetical protein TWF696_003459 [Orbilia brochopaga]|uniref:C3H1-type domain-containing protein n=1 Tax=Orbilia brochopaga TaxID=3140254 RepID=A0AAV9TZJ4_9PEZI
MSSLHGPNIPEDIRDAMAGIPCAVMAARGVCNVRDCHFNHDKEYVPTSSSSQLLSEPQSSNMPRNKTRSFFCMEEQNCGRCKSSKCNFRHKRDTNGVPIEESARTLRRSENRPLTGEYDDGINFIRHVSPATASNRPAGAGPPRAQPQGPSTPCSRGAPGAAPATAAPVQTGEATTNGPPLPKASSSISPATLQDLSQIDPPKAAMKNGGTGNPQPALPSLPVPPAPKRLTHLTAPEPVVSDKRERDLIMIFKAPLLSPLPLSEIERRNLLDTAQKMLSHSKRYMKRFAVRFLSEARPISHLVDISNALLASDVDEEACSLVMFQTRCIPFMKVLGHEYLQVDEEVQNSARKIMDEVFPEPIQAMHLIVRTVACFHQNHPDPENDGIDWPGMYTSILQFLVTFAKLYTKIEEITTATIIVYWAILFLEAAQDSWYIDQSNRETVFDTIIQAVGLLKVDQYFAAATYKRGSLDGIRRLPCATFKNNGNCPGSEDDSCFFSHEADTITGKYVDKANKQYAAMDQWLRFGTKHSVLPVEDLRTYWDQALSFFDEGQENFVVEALTLPEGLLHIGQVLQLHLEETEKFQFSQVESFLKIMYNSRLENQIKIDGKVAEIAQYCAKVPTFFSFWCDFVEAGLATDPNSEEASKIAVLLAGFARFMVNFNPIQNLEKPVRLAMMSLCRIIADKNEEGTGPMADAHDIAERLGFVIRRNLIMGTIDIIDRDRPDMNDAGMEDEPLVFWDEEIVSTPTVATEQPVLIQRELRGMPCDQFESLLSDLKNVLKQDSRSIPIFVTMMESEGKFAILKSFFTSDHEYNPTEATANVGIFPHCLPFLTIVGRFLRVRDVDKEPFLKESLAELFSKMWPPGEFTVFLRNALNDFYHLHRDFILLEDIIKRKVRKGIEGMLRIAITLKKLALYPCPDPACDKLILRFLRIITDYGSPSWSVVQALIVQTVKILGLQRHFINKNLGKDDVPPRLTFRYPKTFRCPERKLSRCQYPQGCQYDHTSEGMKTPSTLSSDSDIDSVSISPPTGGLKLTEDLIDFSLDP